MSRRIAGVERGATVNVSLDGRPLVATAGETLAAAMLADDESAFRHDSGGRARGMFCNMGTCGECFVVLVGADGARRVRRACLTPVAEGMTVERRGRS